MDRKPSQDKPITITHDDDRARLCAPCFRLGIAARITLTRVHRALRTAFLLSLLRQGYSVEISTFSRMKIASILYNFFTIFVECEIRERKIERVYIFINIYLVYLGNRRILSSFLYFKIIFFI